MNTVQNYNISRTKQVYYCGKQGHAAMTLITLKCQNPPEKCIEFVQNSQKWCTEVASYARRIVNFLAQNYDNSVYTFRLKGTATLVPLVLCHALKNFQAHRE